MKRCTRWLATALLAMTAAAPPAGAEDDPAGLQAIQEDWAQVKYRQPTDAQAAAYDALLAEVDRLIQANPGRVEPLIWRAIVLSTQAGVSGGFSALDKVKAARELLLRAEALEPAALQGSIYTSLGTLYYQVPGWPVGFGDDEKAGAYLRRALEINPDGIDANYFYADYLAEEKRYDEALRYAQKALDAPARPDRPIADAGRRAEAQALIARLAGRVAGR